MDHSGELPTTHTYTTFAFKKGCLKSQKWKFHVTVSTKSSSALKQRLVVEIKKCKNLKH